MIVNTYLGTPLQTQKIVPGNTATAVARSVIYYTEYTIGFDSGDYAFAAGDVIVGATSGATGIIVSIIDDGTGTVGGGDYAGFIRFKAWDGTTFTDNEKIKVGADSDVGDIDGTSPFECMDSYSHKGTPARNMLVSVKANTVLMAVDGSTPDQTALVGHNLASGTSYVVHDAKEMRQMKFIDAVASSASTVIVTAYF